MSNVRKFKVKSRLSKLINEAGGITVNTALKQAKAAIETLRVPSLADIDASLAEMDKLFGPTARNRAGESLEDLYFLSTRIIDCAIFLEGSDIDLAARALCELVDRSQMNDVCDWEAIDVHISSIKLLRAAGLAMTDEQRAHVLEGLARVTRKRIGDPNAPGTPDQAN